MSTMYLISKFQKAGAYGGLFCGCNRVKFIFSCTLKTKRSELNDSNIDHGFCSKSRFKLACQSKLSSSHHSQFSFVSSSIIIFPVYFFLVHFSKTAMSKETTSSDKRKSTGAGFVIFEINEENNLSGTYKKRK